MVSASTAHASEWVFSLDGCAVDNGDIAAMVDDPAFVQDARDRSSAYENGVGRLWQLTSKTGEVSHLWGTMHSSTRVALDLPARMREALDGSRLVALEMDYRFTDADEMEAENYNGWWQDTYLPPQPMPLVAGANPELGNWIKDQLLYSGVDPEYVDYLTPGGMLSYLMQDGCADLNNGVIPHQDAYIQTQAHIAGQEIIGLEGSAATRQAMNDPKNRAAAKAVITFYASFLAPMEGDYDPRERLAHFALYRLGHTAVLNETSRDFALPLMGRNAQSTFETAEQFLISDRNRNWLPRAMPELEEGGAFLAVGAGHLAGPDGLVALLRAEGFTVTRVPVEGEDGF